jgi:hypothetical protein
MQHGQVQPVQQRKGPEARQILFVDGFIKKGNL